MENEFELVVLTKSSKKGAYCVAGIDTNNGQWVRLVSSNPSTNFAISDKNMQYTDRSFCEPLDVVRVPVIRYNPLPTQPENVLINEHQRWQKVRRISLSEVLKFHPCEKHDYVFGDTRSYINASQINTQGHSLELILANNLTIIKPDRKSKVSFIYESKEYRLMSVTDSDYYNVSTPTIINQAVLVVSLPDSPYPEDKYFKFVSKIFPTRR